MASDAFQAGKFARHNARCEMRVVVRFDENIRIRKTSADEISDLSAVHAAPSYRTQ
jgi:hypothetical protein